MSFNYIKNTVISGGILVIALVACGKAPTPAVPAPHPSAVATTNLLSLSTTTAIQGNWATLPQVQSWGSDYYSYKFGAIIPNQPSTLTIQHVCNIYGQILPITSQISVPIEVIVPPTQPITTIAPQLIMRVMSAQSAFTLLNGVNCVVSIAPHDSPYVTSGNSLIFNPTTAPFPLTRTP